MRKLMVLMVMLVVLVVLAVLVMVMMTWFSPSSQVGILLVGSDLVQCVCEL